MATNFNAITTPSAQDSVPDVAAHAPDGVVTLPTTARAVQSPACVDGSRRAGGDYMAVTYG